MGSSACRQVKFNIRYVVNDLFKFDSCSFYVIFLRTIIYIYCLKCSSSISLLYLIFHFTSYVQLAVNYIRFAINNSKIPIDLKYKLFPGHTTLQILPVNNRIFHSVILHQKVWIWISKFYSGNIDLRYEQRGHKKTKQKQKGNNGELKVTVGSQPFESSRELLLLFGDGKQTIVTRSIK